MDQSESKKLMLKLIEQAKDLSKERFLAFAKGMYGTDESKWEHLWDTQILASNDIKSIFPFELKTLSGYDLSDFLTDFIDKQIGDEEGAFITTEAILEALPNDAKEEFLTGLKNSTISFNPTIIYNPTVATQIFLDLNKYGHLHSIPQEKINEDYANIISEVFTHERMHLNTRYIPHSLSEIEALQEKETPIRQGIRLEYEDNAILRKTFEDYDEALMDAMATIIEKYSPGDSIEDCLYKLIEERNGKSTHEKIDDTPVLAIFTLFPDELSRWTMFQTFEKNYHNLFLDKYEDIVGGISLVPTSEILQNASYYLKQVLSETLSPEQLSQRRNMLKMLNEKDIELDPNDENEEIDDIDSLLNLVFSPAAMSELPGATQDIRAVKHELDPKKPKEKNGIEP